MRRSRERNGKQHSTSTPSDGSESDSACSFHPRPVPLVSYAASDRLLPRLRDALEPCDFLDSSRSWGSLPSYTCSQPASLPAPFPLPIGPCRFSRLVSRSSHSCCAGQGRVAGFRMLRGWVWPSPLPRRRRVPRRPASREPTTLPGSSRRPSCSISRYRSARRARSFAAAHSRVSVSRWSHRFHSRLPAFSQTLHFSWRSSLRCSASAPSTTSR